MNKDELEYAKVVHKNDNEYIFQESLNDIKGVWITIRNISVYLTVTDEGVIIDLYAKGYEIDSLTGTSLSFIEAAIFEES